MFSVQRLQTLALVAQTTAALGQSNHVHSNGDAHQLSGVQVGAVSKKQFLKNKNENWTQNSQQNRSRAEYHTPLLQNSVKVNFNGNESKLSKVDMVSKSTFSQKSHHSRSQINKCLQQPSNHALEYIKEVISDDDIESLLDNKANKASGPVKKAKIYHESDKLCEKANRKALYIERRNDRKCKTDRLNEIIYRSDE